MKSIQSKVEQVTDHLRDCIVHGDIFSPLPVLRDWCSKLNVSRGTLERAIRILKHEGLLRTQPRHGIYLLPRRGRPRRSGQPWQLRWLDHRRRCRDMSDLAEFLMLLEQRLAQHKIRLTTEMCDTPRLKAIHREGPRPHEMLVLSSFPAELQRRYSDFRNALVVGRRHSGVELPFVDVDVAGAIRHAVGVIAGRGFSRVHLVIAEKSNQPIWEDFARICAEPSPAIQHQVVRLPEDPYEQQVAVRRLAARIRGPHAFIVNSPIPAWVFLTTLAMGQAGNAGPMEVIAMNATPRDVRLFPLTTYYPYPLARLVKTLAGAAVHYFKHGAVPRIRKRIPLRMVSVAA